jgi:hypothetical protein
VSEEKHERPFENNSSEEEPEENKRPHKIRRGPFESVEYTNDYEIVNHHQMYADLVVGNVFDAETFPPEPTAMIYKRLRDEGYEV